MFTSSLTLSAFALTLMHSFAAAAPYPGHSAGNSTSLHSTTSAPPSGTGTHPTHPTISPVVNQTSIVIPPPPQTNSIITSTITHTKTLTWTLNVPCTTTIHGSTSYYSTASVYTTCISEYETVTITNSCGKNCHTPEPTPTTIYFPEGPKTTDNVHTVTFSSVVPTLPTVTPTVKTVTFDANPTVSNPIHTVTFSSVAGTPTTIVPTVHTVTFDSHPTVSNPIHTTQYTCPPAATVTVSAQTVTVTNAFKTVTVTEAYKTVTVTAGPIVSSSKPQSSVHHYTSSVPHNTYTSSRAWNSTVSKPTHYGTGSVSTVTILPTGGYHH